MQIVEFTEDSLRFLDDVPEQCMGNGFVWVYLDRDDFVQHLPSLQNAAQRLGGSRLLELHCEDLANPAFPSHYDFTSVYDLLVFRRLSTPSEIRQEAVQEAAINTHHVKGMDAKPVAAANSIFKGISSKAVGFAVFDRLLISVHPRDCYAVRSFVQRYVQDTKISVDASSYRNRLPVSPADLTLRMINTMVDSYLDLRRELTAQMELWQTQLLRPGSRFASWGELMGARNRLQTLEDLCDEQHDAVQEWLDTIRDTPLQSFGADAVSAQAQRDMLIARARDVLEHINRVLHHARRLEQSAETVVQIHFSAQSNRTNDIMRTLTALTAIFLPLNLIAGIFGMNFEFLPLIHQQSGFWWAIGSMVVIALILGFIFWRKRYLARTRG